MKRENEKHDASNCTEINNELFLATSEGNVCLKTCLTKAVET